jgi:RimJ/RimL family protein N-acetyltransferase
MLAARGHWIRTDASGRGYARETAAALCGAAFEHTAVDRLEIHCDVENARSAAVAQRLGFTRDRKFLQEAPTLRVYIETPWSGRCLARPASGPGLNAARKTRVGSTI